jgi:hypothetical protein
MRVMTLSEDGKVALLMHGTSDAALDPDGCLTVAGELAVDASSTREVWTPYERFVINGTRIELANGRTLQILDDGSVRTFDASGKPEKFAPFNFEGYRREAACAARSLLILFMASMPSMAASDGNLQRLPPPHDSPCFRGSSR